MSLRTAKVWTQLRDTLRDFFNQTQTAKQVTTFGNFSSWILVTLTYSATVSNQEGTFIQRGEVPEDIRIQCLSHNADLILPYQKSSFKHTFWCVWCIPILSATNLFTRTNLEHKRTIKKLYMCVRDSGKNVKCQHYKYLLKRDTNEWQDYNKLINVGSYQPYSDSLVRLMVLTNNLPPL